MKDDPLALSYGLGVDSTAVLVGWWRRGIRPHWIGHAQVGNAWPETHVYRPVIDEWLLRAGFPTITDVRYVAQRPCTTRKWTSTPFDAVCADYFATHIASGGRVVRAIGYAAGRCDVSRGGVETQGPWTWAYPLREWGWNRDRCVAEIVKAGLPVPSKSAGFFRLGGESNVVTRKALP